MKNRERMLNAVLPELAKVQYDEQDGIRLFSLGSQLTDASVLLIQALGAYRDVITIPSDKVDENTADETKKARYDLIRAWGLAQSVISKVAFVTRFDGDEAYRRTIECPEDEDPDLGDL